MSFLKYSDFILESNSNKEYQKYFQTKLDKYGIDTPDDLDEEEKKKFFNEVKKDWKGK